MIPFLNVRQSPVGGGVLASVKIQQFDPAANTLNELPLNDLVDSIRGRHLLIATHGFNVNQADGIAALSTWGPLVRLPDPSALVGVLWPGDSSWAHGLDYPDEPRQANDAGDLLAPFFDQNFVAAATISFASHSLGARLLLRAISRMSLPVHSVIMMAGAIDNDCLVSEFKSAAPKIGKISVLASEMDRVLSRLYPLGTFLGGILTAGHPWLHAALGHKGPSKSPANLQNPFQLPKEWGFDHGDYLRVAPPPPAPITQPTDVPPPGTNPLAPEAGWKGVWSALFSSIRSA